MNMFDFTPKWPFFKKQITVRDEVTGLIETFIDKEGTGFDGQEGLLLRNMLGLRDISAEDVMIPRADIVSVDITDGFESVIRQISEAAHSRVPAHKGNMDELLGMLHIKDLIAHALDQDRLHFQTSSGLYYLSLLPYVFLICCRKCDLSVYTLPWL